MEHHYCSKLTKLPAYIQKLRLFLFFSYNAIHNQTTFDHKRLFFSILFMVMRTHSVTQPTKSPLSAKQIKLLLVIGGFIISAVMILYSQFLVNQLREREERISHFYGDILRYYNNQTVSVTDLWFIHEHITPFITFPMIMTRPDDEPIEPFEQYASNVSIDYSLPKERQRQILKAHIQEMKESSKPVIINDTQGKVLMKIFFSSSTLITQLKLFPYIEIFVISMFIFIGYVAFNYLRNVEQTSVWVGLAKEAAHQLGTPLSSLLAWIEILKLESQNPTQIHEVSEQMYQDVERLNKIAHRFSKIGSQPEMKEENVSLIIQNVIGYFELRLPHLGKKIRIKRNIQHNVTLIINAELFEWVIENLVKNAAEAMESSGGVIDILLEQQHGLTRILVYDNGKGMTQKVKKEAFKPGFSTKKRGWGLGLSLCKRIIEDYHGGKIYIKETAPGKGTIFAIELYTKSLESGEKSKKQTDVSETAIV